MRVRCQASEVCGNPKPPARKPQVHASIGLLPGCPVFLLLDCLNHLLDALPHVLRGGDQHLLSGDVLESTRHNTN